MKKISLFRVALVGSALLIASSAQAGPQAKSYQVTGPVLEVTDTAITVENKAGEKWQVARDAGTKVNGELKVGARVTIYYRMIATDVEVKADKTDKATPTEKPAPTPKPKKTEKQ